MCAHLWLGLLHILRRLVVPLTQPLDFLGTEAELSDPVLTALHQFAVISDRSRVGLFAQLQQAGRGDRLDDFDHRLRRRCRSC